MNQLRNKDNSTIDWVDDATDELTQIKLRNYFNYNAETGQLISKRTNKPVGCLDKSTGYIRYRYGNKNHRVHRLIWILRFGSIPDGFVIDHRDNDRTNNRINNLRLVVGSENNENITAGNKNNKIGIRGVVQSGESFLAIITVKYKKIYLGRFATPEQAGAEYLKHKKLMHKGWSSRGI